MTDRDLRDLLDELCDDPPLTTGGGRDDVLRGKRLLRRRRIVHGGTALASVAVLGVAGVLAPGVLSGDRADPPTGGETSHTLSDAEILDRCAEAEQHAATEWGGDYPPIREWSVAASQGYSHGAVAELLSPGGEFYAYCRADGRGGRHDFYRQYSADRDPASLYAWTQPQRDTCETTDGDHRACLTWLSAGFIPERAVRVTFEFAAGGVSEADVARGHFAWTSETAASTDPEQPVWATFYDVEGDVLERMNANPPDPGSANGRREILRPAQVEQCRRVTGDDVVVWAQPRHRKCE